MTSTVKVPARLVCFDSRNYGETFEINASRKEINR